MKNMTKLLTLVAGAAMTMTTVANAETILFAGTGGVVHALNTDTGAVSFRGVCSGPVSSMAVHDGTLYLGDHNGTIYAYDVQTNFVTNAFAVDSDANAMTWLGDQLVVASSAGTISYIDPQTHVVEHTVSNLGTDITAIGIDAGGLFVGGASTLAKRAHIGQDNFEFFAACGSQIQSMAFGSDTMFLGGIAFGGAQSGTVYLFDKFEGGVNYTGTHGVDSDVTSMVTVNGLLYISGSDGNIHEMDPQSGIISRVFETGIDIQAMTPETGHTSCPADYDASGSLNFLDVSRFINLYTEQLIPGDTNGDGQFNFFDISQFITFYSAGC